MRNNRQRGETHLNPTCGVIGFGKTNIIEPMKEPPTKRDSTQYFLYNDVLLLYVLFDIF